MKLGVLHCICDGSMEVFHWLAKLSVRHHRLPPPSGEVPGTVTTTTSRPECLSFAVIFTLDHVSLSCLTALARLTTFVATRRCRCLLQSVRVNVMPGWLLFVISGILAGGIPGFCIELCCFSHPLWPLFLFLCLLCLFLGWGHYYHGTQAVIMHEL